MTGRTVRTPGCAASAGRLAASIEYATALYALLTRPNSRAPRENAVRESESCSSSSRARCARWAPLVSGRPESFAFACSTAKGEVCSWTHTFTRPFALASKGEMRESVDVTVSGTADSLTLGIGNCCAWALAATASVPSDARRPQIERDGDDIFIEPLSPL